MRLVARQDVPVLLGLLIALLLTFLNPLSRLVGTPSSLLGQFALAALPGFLLMAGVLAFDRWKAWSAPSTPDAETVPKLPQPRSVVLERLLGFTRALAKAADGEGVTSAIGDHLAPLAGTSAVSVLISEPAGWEVFAGDRSAADELLARAHAGDSALTAVPPGVAAPDITASGADVSFPLRVAGQATGLLVVRRRRGDLDPETLLALESAASVLALFVTNLQLARERHTNLRDPLTGCTTRAHGLEVIDAELRRARRSQSPISLLILDVDHLKDINARHGYLCGDAVLAMVGRRLRDVLRRSDLKCRYGGEEFVVVLPETPLLGARRVAETLRREIADRPMPWNGDVIAVTASVGVTQALPGEVSADAIITRAESAVCRAQEEGHNTVRVASDTLASLDKRRLPD